MVTVRTSSLVLIALAVGLALPPPAHATVLSPGQSAASLSTATTADPITTSFPPPSSTVNDTPISGRFAVSSQFTAEYYYGNLVSTVSSAPNGTLTFTYRIISEAGMLPPIPGDPYPSEYLPGAGPDGSLFIPVAADASVDVSTLSRPAGSDQPASQSASRSASGLTLVGFANADATEDATAAATFVVSTNATSFILGNVSFTLPSDPTHTPITTQAFIPTFGGSPPPSVPEPTTLALLPLAMIALATRYRRTI